MPDKHCSKCGKKITGDIIAQANKWWCSTKCFNLEQQETERRENVGIGTLPNLQGTSSGRTPESKT